MSPGHHCPITQSAIQPILCLVSFTSSEAECGQTPNDPSGQGFPVDLHAGHPAPEVPSVAYPGPQPDRIVGGQLNPADVTFGHLSVAQEQLGHAAFPVIRRSDELPRVRLNPTVGQVGSETEASALGKAHKQSLGVYHPEVHTPTSRVVVHDGPCVALVIYPREDSDGVACVQLAVLRNLDVAVGASVEVVSAVRAVVGAWDGPDVDQSPLSGSPLYFSPFVAQTQREHCYRSQP